MTENPVLVNPVAPTPAKVVQVTLPLESLRAVYDLLCHLGPSEFERKLEAFTIMNQEEIREAGYWLDQLFEYLFSEGMRPRKFRRSLLPRIHRPVVKYKLGPWFQAK